MSKTVLVVAAHPDDEILGCGATLVKHVRQGDRVHAVILAEGSTSRDDKRNAVKRSADLAELSRAAHAAKNILGLHSLTLHDFPDNRMDSVDRIAVIKMVEQHINMHQPAIVYTHHCGDLNIDHRIVHEAVVTACRPFPSQPVRTLLFFEVPSSTEWQTPGSGPAFLPNWFIDISDLVDFKRKALEAYQVEMRRWPHARSIEAALHLANWRGAAVGVQAAEAFMVGRNLIG